ncbi:hypothetical protein Hdeb2414_s0029g00706251 [Helianthus debilis subsp. tardiflorus]
MKTEYIIDNRTQPFYKSHSTFPEFSHPKPVSLHTLTSSLGPYSKYTQRNHLLKAIHTHKSTYLLTQLLPANHKGTSFYKNIKIIPTTLPSPIKPPTSMPVVVLHSSTADKAHPLLGSPLRRRHPPPPPISD